MVVGGLGGGVHSHFCAHPNYSVEVVLCCVVIKVVTILERHGLVGLNFSRMFYLKWLR